VTPYEKLYGAKPDLLELPEWGQLSGCTIQVALSLTLMHGKHTGSGMMLTALMPTEFTGN